MVSLNKGKGTISSAVFLLLDHAGKTGIVLDYAMMVTLFFFFSFLIFKFDSNRQHQFKWLLVKYVSQGSILCHLLLFMRIMTSL